MPLYLLHRVLIGFAIALGGLFALSSVLAWRRSGSPVALALAAASLAAAVALAAYLRWFVRKRASASAPGGRRGATGSPG